MATSPSRSTQDSQPSRIAQPNPYAREERFRQALQLQRAGQAENREVDTIKLQSSPPNKGRYLLGGLIALIGDILDVIGSVSVGGAVVEWIPDIIIDVIVIPLVGSQSSRKQKQAQEYSEAIQGKIERAQQYLNFSRQNIFAKASRIPHLPNSSNARLSAINRLGAGSQKLTKLTKVIPKNALAKISFASLADLVPYLDIVPFRAYSVYTSYQDEKKAYQAFQETIEYYYQSQKATNQEQQQLLQFETAIDTELSAVVTN